MTHLLAAFAAAFSGAVLLTPLSKKLARRWGVLDPPEAGRKVHAVPTPRWGGMAIFGGVLAAVGALALLPSFRELVGGGPGAPGLGRPLAGVLIGGSAAWLLGAVDDRRSLPPAVKLLVQVAAASAAMAYGVRMAGVSLPGRGFVAFPLWFSQAVTLLWFIGFMNAINLADGLDGQAAGICAVAAGTFVVVCLVQAELRGAVTARQLQLSAALSAAVCGASLGFLLYNFPPAGVFMGDGGALFLGFMLAAASLIGTVKTGALISLAIPLVAVAIPVSDTAFAVARRWRSRRRLLGADRGHFHHRLLDRGWTPREVTLLAYVATLLLAFATVLLAIFKGRA